ncbi:hypothetical protein HJG60_011891 [Phyllostomus discolor]|uniref:Uncharacterized protein n=1 Tax=Phyllostomus discolor TaxID=89673 RepID=A0A833ZLK4_9CHIR|nr:hypothetical protein HJG60_011891 [Phyllostomus discolor]
MSTSHPEGLHYRETGLFSLNFFFFLFLERREGEGEGEKYQHGSAVSCTPPTRDLAWQARHVPWLGIEPVTFCFTGWHSVNPLSHTSQAGQMALCVTKRTPGSQPVTLPIRDRCANLRAEQAPSPPRGGRRGQEASKETSEMNLKLQPPSPPPAPPPPRHSKINGNIWGKVMLQSDSPVAGDLRQNLFREKGPSYIYAWAGCAPPQSRPGTAPRKPGSRQVFRDCSLSPPAKMQKVSSSCSWLHRLLSARPHSFTHSFTLLLHTHLSSSCSVSGAGDTEMNRTRGPVVKERTFWPGRETKASQQRSDRACVVPRPAGAGTEEGVRNAPASGPASELGQGTRVCKGLWGETRRRPYGMISRHSGREMAEAC